MMDKIGNIVISIIMILITSYIMVSTGHVFEKLTVDDIYAIRAGLMLGWMGWVMVLLISIRLK